MKNMEIKIIFRVNEPENIKFDIDPSPSFSSDSMYVYEIAPNQPIDICLSIIERKGHTSNIVVEKILYEDYDMTNLNDFCTLYKDNKSYKTHGYIDSGVYRIRIRSNPISQHFTEYLLGMVDRKK